MTNGKHTNITATKQHKLDTVNNWILMSLSSGRRLCQKVEVAVLGSPSLIKPYQWFLWNDITSYGGKSKRATQIKKRQSLISVESHAATKAAPQ